MSLSPTVRRPRTERPAWSGTAFLIEALVLLVFLAAATAVFVQLYAHAATQAQESRDLSHAVALATDAAERFAADPSSVAPTEVSDDMTVTCTTTADETTAGTLYRATIQVWDSEELAASFESKIELAREPLYMVTTARYVGGDGR